MRPFMNGWVGLVTADPLLCGPNAEDIVREEEETAMERQRSNRRVTRNRVYLEEYVDRPSKSRRADSSFAHIYILSKLRAIATSGSDIATAFRGDGVVEGSYGPGL